MDHVFATAIFV